MLVILFVSLLNFNVVWVMILIGEFVCGGVMIFCIVFGSCSTFFVFAVEKYVEVNVVVCIDECFFGFYVLGYVKGVV